MSAPVIVARPDDGFPQYFVERLWEMIPETYRHEDGLEDNPGRGMLRSLVELVGEQAAVLRRSHDRLWEDQFAELCDDWALPYLADLVAARLVGALDQRGRRVAVAKTIHYRRRAGTLGLLEQLAVDVAGWDAAVVEQFRRLGRSRHRLDPVPRAGPATRTPAGGWADLRSTRGAVLADGPADEFHYTADVRRSRGLDGRFAIPKLAVHLYRLTPFEMIGVTPFAHGGGRYSFDPSGRDIPLFAPRGRPDSVDGWYAAREWDLAAPIPCRVLGHAEFEITQSLIARLRAQGLPASAAADLRRLAGVRIPDEARLRQLIAALALPANVPTLTAPVMFRRITTGSLVDDCGSAALLAPAVAAGVPELPAALRVVRAPGGPVPRPEVAAANLETWPALVLPGRTIAVDPDRGRVRFLAGAPGPNVVVTVDYHHGFSGPIGAGPYDRRDVDEVTATVEPAGGGALAAAGLPVAGRSRIRDSRTYSPVSNRTHVAAMEVVAAHGERPYLRLLADWVLDAGAQADATLLLDGLWVGGSAQRDVVLRGDYERVTIDRCTIDPGSLTTAGTVEVPRVRLVIEGHVERLVIARSIVGPILTRGAAGIVESLEISDSIVQSIGNTAAIAVGASTAAPGAGTTVMRDVTVFGRVNVHRLQASGVVATDVVTVTDAQDGCFRFGAAPGASRLPRQYESWLFAADPRHAWTSRRFGQPGYAQLTAGAPEPLRRGGEDGIEMGAFASLGTQSKLDGLAAMLDEYMPFGLVPVFLPQT